MKRAFIFLLSLTAGMLLASCEQPTMLSVSQTALSFENGGGNQSVTLTANKVWTASSNQGWLRVSPSSGEGNSTLSISCEGNTTYDTRTGTITIVSEELMQTISVTQAEGLGLLISQSEYNLSNEAQTIEVIVQANVQYTVDIDAACRDWIKQNSTKGLSSNTVKFDISKNEAFDGREGKIIIKQSNGSLSATVVVKQSQTNGLFVSTPEYSLSNEKHTLTVEVKSNIEFEVKPEVDWIRYIGTKGLKTSQITLEVAANDEYDSREGMVIVKQKDGSLTGTITIKQDEKQGLLLSETNFELTNEQQNISFELKYNVPYEVVIPSDCKSWISQVNTKGLDSKYLTFSIAKNESYDNREGSITIKQKDGELSGTVRVWQAQTDMITSKQTSFDLSYSATVIDVTVQANVDYRIVIDDEYQSWISQIETKTLTDSIFYFNIAENRGEGRKGKIILRGEKISAEIIIQQSPSPSTNPEMVDLGLSVKWANCNVGATSPENYGYYFAWAETQNKEDYSYSTYKYYTSEGFSKYNGIDNKTELDLEDDAAHTAWGDCWRTPTEAEWVELMTECTWEWTTVNGVYGYRITSKKDGFKGNNIFLPATGFYSGTYFYQQSTVYSGIAYGTYLTSSLSTEFSFSDEFYRIEKGWGRTDGHTVRPVYAPRSSKTPEIIDLGLSVKWADCNVGAKSPEEYGYYFAWAETQNKNNYSYSNYKYYTGDGYSKYNGIDNKTELDLEDDAAYMALGESWRTPSESEWKELMTECSWEWTTVNGVYGYRITSKKDGFKGNSIFLPATGFYSGTHFYQQSTVYSGIAYGTYLATALTTYFTFCDEFYRIEKGWTRTDGHTVRPVWR